MLSYILAFSLFFLAMKWALSPTKGEQKRYKLGIEDPIDNFSNVIKWILFALIVVYVLLKNH